MQNFGSGRIVHVRKASGELEAFAPDKLEQSLRAAGADDAMAAEILADIAAWIPEGVSTRKIYSRALSRLGRRKKIAGARYRVKNALTELGPTGHPFEVFTGEIFRAKGYATEVAVTVDGAAVTHEMDVIATGGGRQHLVECKYSQSRDGHVSIQVPLYVRSRVDDIVAVRSRRPEYADLRFVGWVVTNTRFSDDSLRYSAHYGIELLSWDYPVGGGLREIIDRDLLYPVTVLQTLNQREKEVLVALGLVTCALLERNYGAAEELRLSASRSEALKRELGEILGGRI